MILITGGNGLTSVEVLSTSGSSLPLLCTLPPLPSSRYGHTQDGLVACGGCCAAAGASCVTLTAEGWEETHQLQTARNYHSSWSSPAGLLMMGGYGYSAYNTTELLTNSSTSPSFLLEYDTV